jgi:hypothetical protein
MPHGRRRAETMSTSTEELIREFERKKHPLARAIGAEEVPKLIEALRNRLERTSHELDLSPRSLKLLEQQLIALKQAVEAGHVTMDDEETMRLMREITAYLGQVVIAHLGGQWDTARPYLWPTMIWIPIPVETIKDGEIRISDRRGYPAADYAANYWDMIGTGKEKGALQRAYKWMTQRRWRERLK